MKIEAARDYYEVVVKPTIAEFLVSSYDVRRRSEELTSELQSQ